MSRLIYLSYEKSCPRGSVKGKILSLYVLQAYGLHYSINVAVYDVFTILWLTKHSLIYSEKQLKDIGIYNFNVKNLLI